MWNTENNTELPMVEKMVTDQEEKGNLNETQDSSEQLGHDGGEIPNKRK